MKTETKKSFDAVKMMREIRDKIDHDLEGKSSEEILKYYEEKRKAISKWKAIRNRK